MACALFADTGTNTRPHRVRLSGCALRTNACDILPTQLRGSRSCVIFQLSGCYAQGLKKVLGASEVGAPSAAAALGRPAGVLQSPTPAASPPPSSAAAGTSSAGQQRSASQDVTQDTHAARAACCKFCGKAPSSPEAPFARCSRCQAVAYCGEECQRADWHVHKVVCAQLKEIQRLELEQQQQQQELLAELQQPGQGQSQQEQQQEVKVAQEQQKQEQASAPPQQQQDSSLPGTASCSSATSPLTAAPAPAPAPLGKAGHRR